MNQHKNGIPTPSTLDELMAARFGIHRGIASAEAPENSKEAIRCAIDAGPVFVEFDVRYSDADHSLRTGHPPQEPLDRIEDILPLFEQRDVYPKIDVKLSTGGDDHWMLDTVIQQVERTDLDFVLVNIGGVQNPQHAVQAESYFCEQTVDNPIFRLNIDLARYRSRDAQGEPELAPSIGTHMSQYADRIYSVSPEIRVEDWDATAEFCIRHGISVVCFWLGASTIEASTLLQAMRLESEHSGLQVYFDISPNRVADDIGAESHPTHIAG